MKEKNIVAVQFEDRKQPGEYSKQEYTYYSLVDLRPGEVIMVPTKYGKARAMVSRIDVKESEIDERHEKLMRTIERVVRPQIKLIEQKCRVCGCTREQACPGGCHRVEPDLCSACADV